MQEKFPLAELRTVEPGQNFCHITQYAGIDPLFDQANAFGSMPLIPQSRYDIIMTGRFLKRSTLPDVVGERFFDKDMLAPPHCFHGGGKMRVVGGRYHHRLYLSAHFVQHNTKILKPPGLRIFRQGLIEQGGVNIAKSYNILINQTLPIFHPATSRTYKSNIQPSAGRRAFLSDAELRQDVNTGGCRSRCPNEFPPG